MMIVPHNPPQPPSPLQQYANNLGPRRIPSGAHDAVAAVRRLARECISRPFPIETGAPINQLLDAGRPLGDQDLHRFLTTQPFARADGSLAVERNVSFLGGAGGPALGINGAALRRDALRENHDPAGPTQ